jgi:replicative DNA helicase
VYRPDYYNINTFEDGTDALGLAELILDKGRNIGTSRFKIQFHPEIPTFTNINTHAYGQSSETARAPFLD